MDSRGEMVAGGERPAQLRLFDPEAEPVVEIRVEPGVAGATVVVEPATATKRCGWCKCERPVGEFAARRHSKDGLYSYCRGCDAERKAERARKLKAGETVAREFPRGVRPKADGKYEAEYRSRYLGKFASVEEAAAAYEAAANASPMGAPASAYQVDDVFAEVVGVRHWSFNAAGYLFAHGNAGDDFSQVRQHIFVWRLAGGSIPDGLVLDHIDHSRANNTLANLRLITARGNSLNRRKPTSPKPRDNGRWQAKVAGESLGTFDTREQAQAVINARVAELIEQETVMHGADLLAAYMAKQPTPAVVDAQLPVY